MIRRSIARTSLDTEQLFAFDRAGLLLALENLPSAA